MQQSPRKPRSPTGMQFYITPRYSLTPGIVLLAIGVAVSMLFAVRGVISHSRIVPRSADRSASHDSADDAAPDDKDEDLSTVETIYVGSPTEAPVPARPGSHDGSVHPFVLVRLPRSGEQVGRIPDTPSGRLLYAWLAAFNHSDRDSLAKALPSRAPDATVAAQLKLRLRTGGFSLLSAKEIQPGLVVFRLAAQDPAGVEVLGTLQELADASPPTIASFSLREISRPAPQADTPHAASSRPAVR